MAKPTIPEFITVHLGAPNDKTAKNVTVPFIDYLKNVASSEIYPTWPENALRANIYAQTSFALNRIYSEYYRSRGYDFDITSDTRYDQKYIYGRDIYDSVAKIVDETFNDYIIRNGTVQPLFAQYCNGTTVKCQGLSQWGTVPLAEDGLTPYEILQYYYGNDISIVFDAKTANPLPSYPMYPLRLGSFGEDVRTVQKQLNRISKNYPAIKPQLEQDGLFNVETELAVRNFQEIFNLTPDGIVGKATWYKIKSIYNAVKRISELQSEGLTLSDIDSIFPRVLKLGDIGDGVKTLQYYLNVIAYFDVNIYPPKMDGIFGNDTKNAVQSFQRSAKLVPDGIVGRNTWNAMVRRYDEINATLPDVIGEDADTLYPGRFLSLGQSGEDVLRLQKFINEAADRNSYIPKVREDGVYGSETAIAIEDIQRNNGMEANGVTGPITWELVVSLAGR